MRHYDLFICAAAVYLCTCYLFIYLFIHMRHCDLLISYVDVTYLFACAAGCCCGT